VFTAVTERTSRVLSERRLRDSPLALRLAPHSLPARVLALAGLPETLPVIMDDNSPPSVT